MTTTPARGLSAVVAYKLGMAVIELLAVVAVLVLHVVLGMNLGALSGSIERHWLHGIGAMLADMVRLVAGGGDARLVVALACDAVTSAVEGLLLQRGNRWARWVILGSTGLPLPWDLDRLVRQPSVVRLALLLVNVAILGRVWWARPGAAAGGHRGLRHLAERGAIAAVTAIGVWLLLSYRLIPLVERHHHVVAAPAASAGRTTDAAGHPADPVNVGLVGEIGEVQLAMQRAGWLPARPVTIRRALGIVGAVALDRSDPRAPVSDLFLDGRREDLAFERQVDASPRRRHHVRFWNQGQHVDGVTLWLGAATFDEGRSRTRAGRSPIARHRTSTKSGTRWSAISSGAVARAPYTTRRASARARARGRPRSVRSTPMVA